MPGLQSRSMSALIYSDDKAVEAIKEPSRKRYLKAWGEFKERISDPAELDNRIPTEEELTNYFKFLRMEKKSSSSTLWTIYSMLNSVVKGKYGERLQKYPRLTTLIKSYDIDSKNKAAVFESEDLEMFVQSPDLTTPYWLVRKVRMFLFLFLKSRISKNLGTSRWTYRQIIEVNRTRSFIPKNA